MRSSVLKCFFILFTLFRYGSTFLKPTSIFTKNVLHSRTPISMISSSSSLNGITYKVANIEKSVNFYTTVLGMKIYEQNAQLSSVKLIIDSHEGEDSSEMILELLGGLGNISPEIGDVSVYHEWEWQTDAVVSEV